MYKGMIVAIFIVNALIVVAFALPPAPPNSMANIFATPAGQNSFMNFFSTSPNSTVTGATPSQNQPPVNKPSNSEGTAAPKAAQTPALPQTAPGSN